MPLGPLDDLLAHQTPDTFDHVHTSDRNFYDRYYFNCHPCSDELFLITGMGQYPNLGTTDVFVAVSMGRMHYVVRASRELGVDRLDTTIGPFGVEVIEGLRRLRVWLEPTEHDVAFDLTFRGSVPCLEEPVTFRRHGARVSDHTSRFAQVGTWEGRLSVADKTFEVTPERWKGARDHSWGVRPIGEPEPLGIRRKWLSAPQGFFHNWLPMQFDDFMLKVFIQEDLDGNRILEEAARVPNFGRDEPIVQLGSPWHRFAYKPGTREIARAEFGFAHSDLTVTSIPLRTNYLCAGSGYRPGPDWAHGMYHGPLVVQGLRFDMGDPAVFATMQGLNETLCRFELSTGEIGYGMHENACAGIYRPYGFDTVDAVAG